jgi:hypothetical protein
MTKDMTAVMGGDDARHYRRGGKAVKVGRKEQKFEIKD